MTHLPDRRLLSYLASYNAHISDLTLEVRELVLGKTPGADKDPIATAYPLWTNSLTGNPKKDGFCHIVTYNSHVNFGFNRGALLPDPSKVLTGTRKSIRHIAIHNQAELDRPCIRRFFNGAIEQLAGPPPRAPTQSTQGLGCSAQPSV